MKTNQEIQDMKKDCAKAIGEVTDGSEDVYKGWIEALNWVTMTNKQPEPVLPVGLQKYIDGVGLNVLYRNYHKSTNGIWSRAEVIEELEDDFKVYEVSIDFGCQDDTRNESYRDIIYAYKLDDDEWTFGYDNPLECEHRHSEHIPQEDDINVREDVICLDCGMSVIDQLGEE